MSSSSAVSQSGSSSSQSSLLPNTPTQMNQPILIGDTSPSVAVNENGLIVEQTADGEWSYDPNEPRYCICNQVSYGDMVACDNEAVVFIKKDKTLFLYQIYDCQFFV